MNTLDQLAENYRTHRDRQPYPADDDALAALAKMQPRHVTLYGGALLSECVSYEQGQPLYVHAYRVGPVVFVRLATDAEFREQLKAAA